MAQPIRKDIIEKNPEVVKEKTFVTLLVDGNNLLRISMADTKTNSEGIHYGGVFQFLLQLRMMITKIGSRLEYVYVFFDDHDSGVLRYNLYNGYKANRDKDYANSSYGKSDYWKKLNATIDNMQNAIYKKNGDKKQEERENFDRERDIILKCLNELYIRWVFDDVTEGDDLIAYYVKNKKPNERIVIMSTDHDLTQLISDEVCVYDKKLNKYLSKENFKQYRGIPVENVVIEKIMLGDSSDNIKGINGLSENRLVELMPEIKDRPVTINEIVDRAKEKVDERVKDKKKPLKWHENIINGVCNGEYDGDFYEINEKIISLAEPMITDEAKKEMDETMYVVQDPEGRGFDNLYKYMYEDGIDELKDSNRFSKFFEPFKPMIDKEIRRFKEETDEKSR